MKHLILYLALPLFSVIQANAQDCAACCPEILDTLYHYTCECGCHKHPVNNYSGLNSLRSRLANKSWSGKMNTDTTCDMVLDGKISGGQCSDCTNNLVSDDMAADGTNNLVPGTNEGANGTNNLMSSINSTNNNVSFIGAPVYVFFKLASTELTEVSQRINIDAIATSAKTWHLGVRVVGAADSATGTSDFNETLALRRAYYISEQLKGRGLDERDIEVLSVGGINATTPIESNRNVRIELFKK